MAKKIDKSAHEGKPPSRPHYDNVAAEYYGELLRDLMALDQRDSGAVEQFKTNYRVRADSRGLQDAADMIDVTINALVAGYPDPLRRAREAILPGRAEAIVGAIHDVYLAIVVTGSASPDRFTFPHIAKNPHHSIDVPATRRLCFEGFLSDLAHSDPRFLALSSERAFVEEWLTRITHGKPRSATYSHALAALSLKIGAFDVQKKSRDGQKRAETNSEAIERITNHFDTVWRSWAPGSNLPRPEGASPTRRKGRAVRT